MSEKILYINSDTFQETVINSRMPVIIDFFSDDCAPCDVLAPIYEKMAEKYDGHIKFVTTWEFSVWSYIAWSLRWKNSIR